MLPVVLSTVQDEPHGDSEDDYYGYYGYNDSPQVRQLVGRCTDRLGSATAPQPRLLEPIFSVLGRSTLSGGGP